MNLTETIVGTPYHPEPVVIKLTSTTYVSHGDPGAAGGSNVTPFRMLESFYPRSEDLHASDKADPIGEEPEDIRIRNLREAEEAIKELAYSYPLPVGSHLAIALQQLTAEQFLASAFIYSLILQLNKFESGNGIGLFSGKERYDQLLKRLAIVGSQYQTSFFNVYSALLRELKIEPQLWDMTDLLWRYCVLPRSVQQSAISCMTRDRQAVVTIARAWSDAAKNEKAIGDGGLQLFESNTFYDPARMYAGSSTTKAEVAIPWISPNAMRHDIFRETLRNHLFLVCELGSMEEINNRSLVPQFVALFFSNGGNMNGKAKAPDNSNAINAAIYRMFPSIELLGGVLPTHIMAGKLSDPVWTLCLQNNWATRDKGFTSDVDAASLLTTTTHTRQTPEGMPNDKEHGQMLYSIPVLKPCVDILLEFRVAPYTSRLACGAMYFAFKTWLENGGQMTGHDNMGFGRFKLSDSVNPSEMYYEEAARAYDEYVHTHREQLREALVSGSLGWKKRLDAWA